MNENFELYLQDIATKKTLQYQFKTFLFYLLAKRKLSRPYLYKRIS